MDPFHWFDGGKKKRLLDPERWCNHSAMWLRSTSDVFVQLFCFIFICSWFIPLPPTTKVKDTEREWIREKPGVEADT